MIVNVGYFSYFWLKLYELFHVLLQVDSNIFVRTTTQLNI